MAYVYCLGVMIVCSMSFLSIKISQVVCLSFVYHTLRSFDFNWNSRQILQPVIKPWSKRLSHPKPAWYLLVLQHQKRSWSVQWSYKCSFFLYSVLCLFYPLSILFKWLHTVLHVVVSTCCVLWCFVVPWNLFGIFEFNLIFTNYIKLLS